MIATSLTLLLVLIGVSIPVGAALGVLGLILDPLYSFLPLSRAMGEVAWGTSNEFLLVAVPLFIMLGEILLRSGLAERMYNAMSLWLSWLPGGLMHANIGASALFAATSGSSVATAATVGTVALPQVKKQNYNEPLFLGSLAAGGTLGILIPPSINLVIYGVLTNTSVPKLYLAGIVPGLGMALLFMAVIALACMVKPAWGGKKISASWSARLTSLVHLIPPLLIFFLVVGSIYAGVATPTEAAALGVIGALILAAFSRRLSVKMLLTCFEGTMKSTAMIMLIVIGAAFLNFIMSGIGLTNAITQAITELGVSPMMMLLVLVVFYLVLGCFMETLSMMITTIPIVAPVMIALGFDPVWLGIVIIILVEVALITPPVGLNLFVVQSLRTTGSMNDVMLGSLPFVLMLLGMVFILAVFPDVALWLPQIFG
ncbi:MAG TPA: TRAP transporter large permease [Paenalcaligenes hominis]|uniref:TRAP transporter large permease protein n=1 Tax=Paenalcaligenes hominis TaxID=643674 RepID=A0A9D2VDX5_9BURK|nr:TRAP transporter large permease [Paenalcaligenes hominis]NJB65505.1 tripartite ATP-independent transporter DctM subunit [Paenalcaligenes hominis]GGE65315.1 membrane protein [Paenalcaligenes hominis]HJH22952.1 TRAP transporter large permease [Paenalcaligenes hominis]